MQIGGGLSLSSNHLALLVPDRFLRTEQIRILQIQTLVKA